MKIFKRIVLAVVALILIGTASLFWLGSREDSSTGNTQALADPAQRVAYGQYLARVGDCMTCHTARGGQPYAGGAAVPTPFGVLYGPNITPDAETGIGKWSADDFWRALHNGKTPDGTLLYPAFPYTEYTRVTRADADALYAYLRSLPAVKQPSRAHELDFPYNQRFLLAPWRALYFKPGVLDAGIAATAAAGGGAPAQTLQSAQLTRGRYLVDGLGHCIACHAPRNALGATDAAGGLAGGEIQGLGWYAPPLTGNPVTGLGRWSADDIVALLKTGTAVHGTATGPMAEVVTGGSQYLADGDAQAIAVYLKSLPAPAGGSDAPRSPSAAAMQVGGKIYEQHCVQCHQASGKGSGQAWPPLAGNISVTATSSRNAIRVVLEGGFAPATAANPQPHGMPPFGPALSDNDVAAVVTYIRNSWGNAAGDVSPLQVKQARESTG
jgi:mono/diheme cytochrome c family protein